ncbi:hypothetical protein RBS60_13065 [Sinomonas sp. ASV486]|uniref:hypothetical protein n=1 Tax=Sinomonas sp. ASV486 TaxID=3051170 RepID=UPI0027DD5141|nr:hypothetical protein [Sinomonas sp. ASV486]MDQ4491127.1 hypothetical protein [Sinomonas sp. ASV486]
MNEHPSGGGIVLDVARNAFAIVTAKLTRAEAGEYFRVLAEMVDDTARAHGIPPERSALMHLDALAEIACGVMEGRAGLDNAEAQRIWRAFLAHFEEGHQP